MSCVPSMPCFSNPTSPCDSCNGATTFFFQNGCAPNFTLCTTNVLYCGTTLVNSGITNGDSLNIAFKKIDNLLGGTIWGSITGTITNQTDLINYLSSNYTPQSRTLTINGVTQNLSSNRTWNVGDVLTSGSYANPSWITSLAYTKLTGSPTLLSQFTNDTNFITRSSLSGGTGISYNNLTGVITNSAPDQTVVLNSGLGISVTGSYPNFTVSSTGSSSIIDINIGDWDMFSGPTGISVAHGITNWKTIRVLAVTIRNNADTQHFLINAFSGGVAQGGVQAIDSIQIALGILSPGLFVQSSFGGTGYNRGFITLQYTP